MFWHYLSIKRWIKSLPSQGCWFKTSWQKNRYMVILACILGGLWKLPWPDCSGMNSHKRTEKVGLSNISEHKGREASLPCSACSHRGITDIWLIWPAKGHRRTHTHWALDFTFNTLESPCKSPFCDHLCFHNAQTKEYLDKTQKETILTEKKIQTYGSLIICKSSILNCLQLCFHL